MLLIALPLALPLQMAMPRPSLDRPFEAGMSRYAKFRGDKEMMVFTRLDPASPTFRQRAKVWANDPGSTVHPRFNSNSEDMALRFTRNREAAQRMDVAQAVATLCLYEDGTPSRWLDRSGDCFADHDSFSEKLAQVFAQRPKDEPPELRSYFSARQLCDQVKPPRSGEVPNAQLAATSLCESLGRQQKTLREKYPDTPGL